MVKRKGNTLIVDIPRSEEFGGIKQVKMKLNGEQVFLKEFTPTVPDLLAEVTVTLREDGNFVEVDTVAENGLRHAVLSWNDATD